ncbi:SAM-dependent methyltransferase [Xanthomonas oryzae]|uniref:SAM-dependent methyltransferase n=1 Tax=Xanthomonas oryzae TaxID=347 RepID=UPI00040D5873|nr:cyclopropane-fatty-acyl-phospholipid synthase family protein [Xanthomonas oryzae]ALS94262.1 cyclopropane-fatty-acyl-phospholipid synthase [Xanthomonas oryzae pv. oryzae]AUI91175.1 SAM-dependent methyltransferase [Xanthomonas oryzae pv. oryzae]AUI94847.1 SAM-dependent methyltransferase [Xanthomonas oryzae pv. oryzae]AUI98520.1 SAM-dependent methyltransferase [Xanthomonas oryzae pv. oryzae]AUJ02196.1 SAM-dependent methyltransferase [Xanthomonas oryzae pv. oryzae]
MPTVTVPPSTQPEEAFVTRLAESGVLPDAALRYGIRRLCAQRLRDERGNDADANGERQRAFIDSLRASAIAIETDAANRQHYELPPQFFALCLGRRLKYSSCYWDASTPNLDAAEERMLALYGERAELADGQRILELGCGWGSLTLWMAERYPGASITAVSNSRPQRAHILDQCRVRGLSNVQVITADVNALALPPGSFDRVVSVEMFEHMRNYRELLARVGNWMAPGGKLFVHIFCHRDLAYPFEVAGEDNWMGRHFFTGGLMPAADTLLHFQQDVVIEQRWVLSGEHYEKTANAWLENQDRHRDQIMPLLKQTYGDDAQRWWQRWRMFWLACAELFGYDKGREWGVAHYRFVKR